MPTEDEPTHDERVEYVQHRITAALAALRGARAVRDHCPSIENEQTVDRFEATLAGLLDELTALHKAEEMAAGLSNGLSVTACPMGSRAQERFSEA